MKNVWKLCLLMALCLSLLLAMGCAKKDVTGTTQGSSETTEDKQDNGGAEVELPIDGNPEGDPTDGTEEQQNGDNAEKNDGNQTPNDENETTEETKEVDVNIGEDTQPEDNDFEIDFGDLT